MRQILYVSTSTVSGDGADLARILNQSRHNNALDEVTGLLFSNGKCLIQVLEGSTVSVEPCLQRIMKDDRHHSIEILMDRIIFDREFGEWNMLHRRKDDPVEMYKLYIDRLLSHACDQVRVHFKSFLATGSHANVRPATPAPIANGIPLLTFVSGRFHWDEIRNGVVFEASGPGGPIKYIITPAAIAELANDSQTNLDAQQCMNRFKKLEHHIHRIAQRERRPFEENLPLIVIRGDDVRGE
ncbi:BLUF domain-containing protein [Sphingomonas sp. PAMC 26621]|uniref:BLUF domain-containing protein n=1 Tax=Sphingomonas sp. PAMC 26621 TaxID=1112213 RepID=UPI0002889866|nr:BLUF domain-containing protein [Sphingomonas sp. PAMC 26621]